MSLAIVTGGAAGLGRTMALALKNAGYAVFACDVDHDGLASLSTAGVDVEPVRMQDFAAVSDMLDRVSSKHGAADVLVNNVGIAGRAGPMESLSIEDFRESIDVNLLGAVATMQRLIPAMKKRRSGSIINISTASVRTRPVNRAPYVVSKAALEALTLTVARECAPFNVRCNCIRPGGMDNERLTRVLTAVAQREGRTLEDVEAEQLKAVGIGRKIQMREVTDLMLYLAGPLAGAITGQVIEVDGGLQWEM